MLTRNFDNIVRSAIMGSEQTAITQSERTEANWLGGRHSLVKSYDNKIVSLSTDPTSIFAATNDNSNGSNLNVAYPILLVGSGSMDETYDDYQLNLITSLTVHGSRTTIYKYTDESATMETTKIFINNTGEDIIINEAGIYTYVLGFLSTSSSSSTSPARCLTYRKKYDTPIVVPANGGTVNITLEVDIPLWNKPNE